MQIKHHNTRPLKLKVEYMDQSIIEVTEVKFLGIYIACHLNQNIQVKNCVIYVFVINKYLSVLRKIKKKRRDGCALDSIQRIRSFFYVWSNNMDEFMSCFLSFFNSKKSIRAIFSAGHLDSCRPLFKKNKILNKYVYFVYG